MGRNIAGCHYRVKDLLTIGRTLVFPVFPWEFGRTISQVFGVQLFNITDSRESVISFHRRSTTDSCK